MAQKLTVYLLKDFFENTLNLSGEIENVVFSSPNSTLTTCDIWHLRAGMSVNVDGTDYTVISVDQENNTFTIDGDRTGATNYTVSNPFYFWGTPLQAQTEISNTDPSNKYPFVYLKEIFRERNFDAFSPLVRESEVRLFFLDEMNKADWHTREFYEEVLVGLNKLVDEVIRQLRDDPNFFTERVTYDRTNHSDFGLKIVSNQGRIEALFADNLSGVELVFTLPVRECCNCSNCN